MSLKLRQTVNSAAITPSGFPLELGVTQAQGVTVDNYSGFWLQVGSGPLFVPPFTLGWASSFYGQIAGSVLIRKATPTTTLINPTAGTQEGAVVAALYEEPLAPNPGYPIVTKPQHITMDFGTDVAGVNIMQAFVQASAIQAISISIIQSSVGTLGRAELYVRDPNLLVDDLMGVVVSPASVSEKVVEFSPPLVPRNFIAGLWRFSMDLTDRIGVGTYEWLVNAYVIGN